jgi:putative glutamine amidotransferase
VCEAPFPATTEDVPRQRPLIAVTSSEMRDPPAHLAKAEADPRQREMALGLRYLEALAGAGALPMVVPPLPQDALEDLLETVDGVLFSGGPDIDPSAYGQEPTPCLGPTEPELDAFELTLAHAADRCGLPILAICRGSQLINVARGGTLHQHLPDLVGAEIQHRQRERVEELTHRVAVEPDSRLAEILGWDDGWVNSLHHQAVDTLGEGLRISARAPDGTVEAFEAPDHPFLIAVQWHAEGLVGWPQHRSLFEAFVAACRAPARRTWALA